jgi:hypothetical protein
LAEFGGLSGVDDVAHHGQFATTTKLEIKKTCIKTVTEQKE